MNTWLWQNWLSDLPKASKVKTRRCIKPDDFGKLKSAQLIHFSDSSEKGYGVVSFIRLINMDGRIHCCLLLSKSRVAPLKMGTRDLP